MNGTVVISLSHILLGTCVLVLLSGIFQFLVTNWLKARLTESIRHEYEKKLEDFRFSQTQRQKIENIAKFFAKWVKYRGKEQEILTKNELIDYYEELNILSFQLSLWIKDEELLRQIMHRTQLKDDAQNIREILGQARKLIHNIKKDKFDHENITVWPKFEIAKELFKL